MNRPCACADGHVYGQISSRQVAPTSAWPRTCCKCSGRLIACNKCIQMRTRKFESCGKPGLISECDIKTSMKTAEMSRGNF
jgi:hypothetical protein